MKSILDPTFVYTKSIDTDIRKTFERVKKERAEELARMKAGIVTNVQPIVRKAVK